MDTQGRGRPKGRLQKLRRMHHGPARREALASDAWRLFMKVAEKQMEHAEVLLEEIGLSPVMGHFLDEIAHMGTGTLSQLGARMGVDPGWVTDVVDKLEQRGEVRRVTSSEDRRVKMIELTEKGRETWRYMDGAIAAGPAQLADLAEHELRTLLRIAERLAKAAGVEARPEI
jgi:DNA-binding MarR family transcriptional regulator